MWGGVQGSKGKMRLEWLGDAKKSLVDIEGMLLGDAVGINTKGEKKEETTGNSRASRRYHTGCASTNPKIEEEPEGEKNWRNVETVNLVKEIGGNGIPDRKI